MLNFSHVDATRRVHAAPGVIDQAGAMLDQIGASRALIVVGATMASGPQMARLRAALGPRLAGVLAGVTPHSGPQWVRQGLALARQTGADAIVSIGGGSTIDTAKCIALNAALGGDIEDLRVVPPGPPALNAQQPYQTVLPHLCIPTTGSGSEVTPGAGLRAPNGQKWIYWHISMTPEFVLLDPEVAVTTPIELAAQSSLNSLAHAIEALYAVNRQPLTDAFATGAVQLFAECLPRFVATPDDLDVRATLQHAWLLAGLSIANARVALHHAMCHCLGARFDVSHGAANSIMLPHVMRFNRAAAQAPLARAGRAFGAHGDAASLAGAAIDAVIDLQRILKVPTRLRAVGVPADGLDALAEDAMAERGSRFNPRPVDHAAVRELYRAAW